MSIHFSTLSIIGVGLLGGSLGLAVKERQLADRVLGVGRRQVSLDQALEVGAIDEAFTDPETAMAQSDAIVLCTPAAQVTAMLDLARTHVRNQAIVTDVASTKREICHHARDTWPRPRRFVGSHPMAGSEKFGPEHADASLYDGAVCFVEEASDGLDADAVAAVVGLWSALGARTVSVNPATHDRLVALTSHVPHIAAAALTQLVADEQNLGPFIGSGFKDTTRVAEGRPEVWRDISLTNRDAILDGVDATVEMLNAFRRALDARDADALDAFFERGRAARERALER